MSKTARIIVKSTEADRDDFRAAVQTLRDEGKQIDVRVTWDAEQIREYAASAGECDALVGAGGDGMMNLVLNGLLKGCGAGKTAEELPSLGIVPIGTANDFATSCDMPVEDLLQSLRLAVSDTGPPVDVGRVGERYFLNMVTAGAGASATRDAPKPLKEVFGKAAYLFSGLGKITNPEPIKLTIQGDDFSWEEAALALIIANGPQAGGGLLLCPNACIDDGQLEVCLVNNREETGRMQILRDLLRGEGVTAHPEILCESTHELRLSAREEFVLNLDGEPVEIEREARVKVMHRAVRLNLPASCPLLCVNSAD